MRLEYIENLLLPAVAFLTLAAGCQKGIGGSPAVSDLTASIAQGVKDDTDILGDGQASSPDSKTFLSGDDRICWSTGDKIFVNGTGTSLTVTPLGDDATTAALSGTIPAPAASGRKYCGYYPANTNYWTVSTSAKQVKLPATQYYDVSSPLNNIPMYAESDGKHLVFKPLFGILEFTVTGSRKVKSITLTANKNINGTFNLNADGSVSESSGSGTKQVILDFGASGVTVNGGIKVYIPLPSNDYTSLKIQLATVEGETAGIGGEAFNKDIGSFTVKQGKVYFGAFSSDVMAVQLWPGGPYWATANIGATSPTGRGDFFSWGSVDVVYSSITNTSFTMIASKDDLPADEQTRHTLWDASKGFRVPNAPYTASATSGETSSGEGGKFSKYVMYDVRATWGKDGTFYDNKNTLDAADDVVYKKWGGNWRMPTRAEYEDLLNKTTVTTATVNSMPCFKYTSKNDATKYILLPKAGYCANGNHGQWQTNGYYWTSSLNESTCNYAYNLILNTSECHIQDRDRSFGWTIRGIRTK